MLMLIVGVAWLAATPWRAGAEGGAPGEGAEGLGQGNGAQGAPGGLGAQGTPEVVLQLKYDGGELDRILLTQYRAPAAAAAGVPAHAERAAVCADLCFAGLGGRACGSSCPKLLPVGLKMALAANSSAAALGAPRTAVCPVLCENDLGDPLCSCGEAAVATGGVDWAAVCTVFCDTDQYELSGCGSCEESSTSRTVQVLEAQVSRTQVQQAQVLRAQVRLLSTAEGWQSWCNVQCHQGQGGAACNCDRAPFQ